MTSTFQIGGTNLFSCNGYYFGGGSFWLTPQNANNSQFLTGVGGCTANWVGFTTFDFSTSTIWKIFGSAPSGGDTMNGAITVLAF
jgi:hypothetical protein